MVKAVKVPGGEQASEAQPIQQSVQPMPEGLPNAVDVDPRKITGPVLTRQGWICPPDRPAPQR